MIILFKTINVNFNHHLLNTNNNFSKRDRFNMNRWLSLIALHNVLYYFLCPKKYFRIAISLRPISTLTNFSKSSSADVRNFFIHRISDFIDWKFQGSSCFLLNSNFAISLQFVFIMFNFETAWREYDRKKKPNT